MGVGGTWQAGPVVGGQQLGPHLKQEGREGKITRSGDLGLWGTSGSPCLMAEVCLWPQGVLLWEEAQAQSSKEFSFLILPGTTVPDSFSTSLATTFPSLCFIFPCRICQCSKGSYPQKFELIWFSILVAIPAKIWLRSKTLKSSLSLLIFSHCASNLWANSYSFIFKTYPEPNHFLSPSLLLLLSLQHYHFLSGLLQ